MPKPHSLNWQKQKTTVAWLVANGWVIKKIARELGKSPATVRNQLHAAYNKLGVNNKTSLAASLSLLEHFLCSQSIEHSFYGSDDKDSLSSRQNLKSIVKVITIFKSVDCSVYFTKQLTREMSASSENNTSGQLLCTKCNSDNTQNIGLLISAGTKHVQSETSSSGIGIGLTGTCRVWFINKQYKQRSCFRTCFKFVNLKSFLNKLQVVASVVVQ